MQKQLGFLVDLGKCVGCRGCEVACSNKHQLDHLQYRRVMNINKENQVLGFLSLACNHCINPECIRVCKEKCFYKRRDGVVLYNYFKNNITLEWAAEKTGIPQHILEMLDREYATSRNLLAQDTTGKMLRKELDKLELIVTVEQFLTETACYSDIVLPATTQFEE